MKKVLTSIGNPMLNKKIRQQGGYLVLSNDLTNDEEVIEWLEKEKEIQFVFLNSKVIKHYKVDEFVKIIQKLQKESVIILFQDKNLDVKLEQSDNLKIYDNSEIEWEIVKKLLQENVKNNIEKDTAKVIAISGTNGIGKSTFSTFLAKSVEKGNKKTLLIDFDLDESQIRTILKVKKHSQQMDKIKNLVIKVNKNLDVICHLDFIFENRRKVDFFKVQEELNELRKEYDFIIIDTSSRFENEYIKRIFYYCDSIIFLLEPNILGIKKSQNMLEVIQNDWKIANEKVNLILNKTNLYQISENIIEELFPDFNLIGKMKYRDTYNLMINNNIDKKEIKKEYEKIFEKICKLK